MAVRRAVTKRGEKAGSSDIEVKTPDAMANRILVASGTSGAGSESVLQGRLKMGKGSHLSTQMPQKTIEVGSRRTVATKGREVNMPRGGGRKDEARARRGVDHHKKVEDAGRRSGRRRWSRWRQSVGDGRGESRREERRAADDRREEPSDDIGGEGGKVTAILPSRGEGRKVITKDKVRAVQKAFVDRGGRRGLSRRRPWRAAYFTAEPKREDQRTRGPSMTSKPCKATDRGPKVSLLERKKGRE